MRNWATFGLRSQIGLNTPEIREAFWANVNDPNEEFRGEALAEIARCGDPETCSVILKDWAAYDSISSLSLEVFALLGDPALLKKLEEFREEYPGENDDFDWRLKEALAACGGGDKRD